MYHMRHVFYSGGSTVRVMCCPVSHLRIKCLTCSVILTYYFKQLIFYTDFDCSIREYQPMSILCMVLT